MAKPASKTEALPLKLRIKAWWEGYDPEDISARLNGRKEEAPAPAKAKPEKPKDWETRALDAEAEEANAADEAAAEELPLDPWDDKRVDVAQYIWGEGYCGPGGTEHIVSMSKLLALSPEMSMVEIGSGLGGPARTLADRFGTWVTGYEVSEKLTELANEKSTMAGLAKKVVVRSFDPDVDLELERKFDRAFSKESLHAIENKNGVIEAVEKHLKPGGLVLITDYVIGRDGLVTSEAFRKLKSFERRKPRLITADEMVEMCKKVGLQTRVSEDISDQYIKMIAKAWAGADKVIAKLNEQEDGEALTRILLREAEMWQLRSKLLQSGDMRIWRLLVSKRAEKPSMMSNW